jgi:hypothetical protein
MSRHTFWQRFMAVVGVALLVAVVGSRSPDVFADPKGFVFTPLVFLGDPAPGGGVFLDTFESNIINNRGDVLFGSNVAPGDFPKTGLFLLRKGEKSEIARAGQSAPAGGVFAFGFLSPTTLNDKGDVGFPWLLEPFCFPNPSGPPNDCPTIGVNTGVYRFSHNAQMVTPVMIPEVTDVPEVPGGGVFKGAQFGVSLNNRGDLVFGGIMETEQGIHLADEDYIGLGGGLFKASKTGQISSVVGPGDPAPGDKVFDWTAFPSMNDRGDVAFMGHVAGEECLADFPQAFLIGCLGSVYVKDAATGTIRSIAHAGDDAPGGGVYRLASNPVINARGDIAFLGDLTSSPAIGVYLHSGGQTIAVARPGDPMPGGGRLVTAGTIGFWQLDVNNAGDVVFNAALDTDDNTDDKQDTGLYLWSHGSLRLVARTGTVVPGVGTIAHLGTSVPTVEGISDVDPYSGANNNDRGQVVFGATLSDGRGVLLVATPKP